MDLETKMRQNHKENLQAAWRLLDTSYVSYMKDVAEGVLNLDENIQDLLHACRARMNFAFYTILDIVCDTYDQDMASQDIDVLHSHPDGLLSCLQTIVDNYQNELT